MALIKCEECGGQLSDRAVQCPACGAPQRMPVPPQRRTIAVIFGVVCLIAAGYYASRVWEELESGPTEQPSRANASQAQVSPAGGKTEQPAPAADSQTQMSSPAEGPVEQLDPTGDTLADARRNHIPVTRADVERARREELEIGPWDGKYVTSDCAQPGENGRPDPIDSCLPLTPAALRSLMGHTRAEVVAIMGASGDVVADHLDYVPRSSDEGKRQTGLLSVQFEHGKSVKVAARLLNIGRGIKAYAWQHGAAAGEYFCSDFPGSTVPCWPPIPPEYLADGAENREATPIPKAAAKPGSSGRAGSAATAETGTPPEIEAMEPGRHRIMNSPCAEPDFNWTPSPYETCQPFTVSLVRALQRATREQIAAYMGASGSDDGDTIAFESRYKTDYDHKRREGDTGVMTLDLEDGKVKSISVHVLGPGDRNGIYEWSVGHDEQYTCYDSRWRKLICPSNEQEKSH
jgi:hypothetical protein